MSDSDPDSEFESDPESAPADGDSLCTIGARVAVSTGLQRCGPDDDTEAAIADAIRAADNVDVRGVVDDLRADLDPDDPDGPDDSDDPAPASDDGGAALDEEPAPEAATDDPDLDDDPLADLVDERDDEGD